MTIFGLEMHRPRVGQWVAVLGFVSTLLGSTLPFLVRQESDPPQRYMGFQELEFVGTAWPETMLAIVAVSLVAALAGATIVSLSGAMIVLGSIYATTLPEVNFFNALQPGWFGFGLGFWVMEAGVALAALGSAVDLRERIRAGS